MTIILYDFPSKTGDAPWNPNVWKTRCAQDTAHVATKLIDPHRYTLNYKGIPFKTELIKYVEVEKVLKEKGVPPSSNLSPTATYTYALPSIFDTSTGARVSESHRIAEYLDKTYPDTPKVIPPGTEALQTTWIEAVMTSLGPLRQFSLPGTLNLIVDSESREYFHRSRTIMFGKDLKEMTPQGEAWDVAIKELEKGFNAIDQWILKSGGPYVMGDTPSFADFVLAGFLKWTKASVGKDSKEWQLITSWNEGRWAKRLEQLAKYENPQ